MQTVRANIWRYYAFQAVWGSAFFVPVVVLFWQKNGLDAGAIYLLQALYALAAVLLEVPTGMLADRIGKRTSLLGGCVAMTLGFVLYALSSSFAQFLGCEILLAVGITMVSGADTALLFDTLNALGETHLFIGIEGRARAIQMVSIAVSTALGGVIGAWSYRATLWATALGPAVAIFLALGFYDIRTAPAASEDSGRDNDPEPRDPASAPVGGRPAVAPLRDVLKFVRKHRLVRWYVVFLAVLSGSSAWLLWMYQPYMQWVGLPVWAFGLAFALFNLVAAWASTKAAAFDRHFGRHGALVALGLLQLASPLLMALLVTPLSWLFVLGQQWVRGTARVLISERILRYTFADKRATILSVAALGGRSFFALTGPVIGWLNQMNSLPRALLFQTGLLLAVLLAMLLWFWRIPAKYFAVKPSVAARR